MRQAKLPSRLAIAGLMSLVVVCLSALPAAAVTEPTPEQKQEAAQAAATKFCADGLLGTVLVTEALKEKCVAAISSIVADHGRQATLDVICVAMTSPVGPVIGTPARMACERLGQPVVDKLIGLYDAALVAAGAVVAAAKFVANPTSALDSFVNTLQAGSTELVERVLPELSRATSFDPTASWWLRHYAAAAGLGILVMAVMLLITTVQTARNTLSGDDLSDAVFQHLPTGLLLMVFGPAIGTFLVGFANKLAEGIVSFIAPDMGAFLGKLAVFSQLTQAIPGGVIVGFAIYVMLFLGAVGLLLGLLLQTLTLYFTGIACAIAFGMWVNPKWRKKAMKIPFTWLGVLFAKPLLFLLLGAAFGLANYATSSNAMTDPGLRTLTNAALAALALLVAGMAPFALLKYAPLLPDGSDSTGSGGSGVLGSAVAGTASQVTTNIAMRRAYQNADSASQQEAAVLTRPPGSGPDEGGPSGSPSDAATADRSQPRSARVSSPSTPAGAGTGAAPGASSSGASGVESAVAEGSTPATSGAAGTAGTAGGAAAGGAAAGGKAAAGAASGGALIVPIVAAELGRAALEKARNTAENAAPDIPARDGD